MPRGSRASFLRIVLALACGAVVSFNALPTAAVSPSPSEGANASPETGEAPAEEPPAVVSTDPKDGDSINYFLYQFPRPISITFSKEMDRASAEQAFSVSPSLEGAFSWDGNTMIFTPSTYPLTFEMTVTVGTGAKDARGSPLREPYSFRYRLVIMK
ncbi:MAG: Ig-like domain-containing protein [Nitrospirota bacterium]|jgi:hypothetical protein